jgi:hypothetical protein
MSEKTQEVDDKKHSAMLTARMLAEARTRLDDMAKQGRFPTMKLWRGLVRALEQKHDTEMEKERRELLHIFDDTLEDVKQESREHTQKAFRRFENHVVGEVDKKLDDFPLKLLVRMAVQLYFQAGMTTLIESCENERVNRQRTLRQKVQEYIRQHTGHSKLREARHRFLDQIQKADANINKELTEYFTTVNDTFVETRRQILNAVDIHHEEWKNVTEVSMEHLMAQLKEALTVHIDQLKNKDGG